MLSNQAPPTEDVLLADDMVNVDIDSLHPCVVEGIYSLEYGQIVNYILSGFLGGEDFWGAKVSGGAKISGGQRFLGGEDFWGIKISRGQRFLNVCP